MGSCNGCYRLWFICGWRCGGCESVFVSMVSYLLVCWESCGQFEANEESPGMNYTAHRQFLPQLDTSGSP